MGKPSELTRMAAFLRKVNIPILKIFSDTQGTFIVLTMHISLQSMLAFTKL